MTISQAEKRRKRCCFTGHRPGKLKQSEKEIKAVLSKAIDQAIQRGFRTFITGMAQGVDLWAAELVIERKQANPDLHLICAIPHPGFEHSWSPDWQNRYHNVLNSADLSRIISPHFSMSCYQKRNMWMVDHSSLLIAAFNGEPGGTRNTIQYAQQTHVETIFIES